MARIPVMNPPGKLTRPRLYRRKKRLYRGPKSTLKPRLRLANPKRKKKRVSAKRRAALIALLKKARAARAKKSIGRRHRRVVKRARKIRRRQHGLNFNPFGTEMLLVGNPAKRSKRRTRSMARRRRRSHRKRYMNPVSVGALLQKPKEMVSKSFLMDAGAGTVGFLAPAYVMNFLPATWRTPGIKFYASKIGTVAVLSAVAGLVSKRASQFVMIGGGISILADLFMDWRSRSTVPAPAAGTQYYYGDQPGVGYYYGQGMGDSIVLSDDNGEDGGY